MYTVLFSVVAGLVQAGALPSIITTLQKRFGFSSTLMGFVLALMDAVMVVIAIPVGHYGSRGNKARLTAIGFCTINVSLILFALPHFVTPKYEPDINGASDRIECNPGGSNNEYVAEVKCLPDDPTSTLAVVACAPLLSVARSSTKALPG